jgi:hypothetical protein
VKDLGYDDVCCDTCSHNGGYQYFIGTDCLLLQGGSKVQVWWG